MMKRTIFFIIIVALVFGNIAYARTYKIGTPAWAGFSPANVADARGFWQEEGLDIKVFSIANPDEALNLFKTGVVDIAFDMIGTGIGLYMEGLPITIIAETDWSHGGDKIIAKKDIDATALKGKPIGVYYDKPSITYFLNQYLSAIGLKLSDTRIIEMELDVLADRFISGQLNIIVSYDPEALRAEREGNGRVVATSATYPGCIPEGMMILEDNLKTIPQDDLVKIFKGWVKAATWSQNSSNWQEYMQILNNETFKNDAPYSEKDLQDMVAAVSIHDAKTLLERNQDDGGLQNYLRELKMFLASNNLLKKDFIPEEIFNNSMIVEALNNP